jgi:hypothetical protein
MEWADRIEVHNGKLVARVVSNSEDSSLVPIDSLGSRGLPKSQSTNHRISGVWLTELRPVVVGDYLAAHGFSDSVAGATQHTLYEHETVHRRVLIPALALIRGLFGRTDLLLPEVFSPQVVERICMPVQESPCEVRLSNWANDKFINSKRLMETLAWLSHDKKTERSATSVHHYAMEGRLDIELPSIQVDLFVRGLKQDNVTYAHGCTVTQISTNDVSSLPSEAIERKSLERRTSKSVSVVGFSDANIVLPRRNGEVCVTDDEWRVLSLVAHRKSTRMSDASLRLLVDGIFTWLSDQNIKWKSLSSHGVPYVRYLHHYREWVRSGVMERLVDSVNEMRSDSGD